MREIVGVYKELTDDESDRMIKESYEIARRDAVSLLDWVKREGTIEAASILMTMKVSIDDIVAITGLAHDEVEKLHPLQNEADAFNRFYGTNGE